MSNEKIGQRAAEEFRRENELGLEPIGNIARLIEKKMGVGVAFVNAQVRGHGMTMQLGERIMMAVACTERPMRLRSTLAHELGHLRLGTIDRSLADDGWDKRRPEEIQADAFARHLLVPLGAVKEAIHDVEVTPTLLSDLVQKYLASPQIVAIQLREAKAIDGETCSEWSTLSTARLASQFGWHAEYQALVTQSATPRPPQDLMARTIEGYRWSLVTPATIARLGGQHDVDTVSEQLEAAGIVPVSNVDMVPERPAAVGEGLTPEELASLQGGPD